MIHILETHAISEEKALELGTSFLETDADNITVKLQKKGSSKFLGFGQSQPHLYYVFPKESTDKQVIIRGIVHTVLSKMGYSNSKVTSIKEDDGKIYVDITSSWIGHIIGKKGYTIDALQVMVNTLLERQFKESFKIVLDIQNYRDKRKTKLEDLALKLAGQVLESGKSKLLYPLNPYERRIIHMVLQEKDNISTESEGDGLYKKIRIKYTGEEMHNIDMPNDDLQNDNIQNDKVLEEEDTIPEHITNDAPPLE